MNVSSSRLYCSFTYEKTAVHMRMAFLVCLGGTKLIMLTLAVFAQYMSPDPMERAFLKPFNSSNSLVGVLHVYTDHAFREGRLQGNFVHC